MTLRRNTNLFIIVIIIIIKKIDKRTYTKNDHVKSSNITFWYLLSQWQNVATVILTKWI